MSSLLGAITSPKPSKASLTFWLSLSLTFAALYGILALQEAFSSEYVVQDDARQHVFWMRRFLDPALFPQDLIADYFQSVAPWGYTNFYRGFATLGIDPMLLAKLLPIGLGLVTAAYSFYLSLQLLPVPFTGFLSTLLIQQVIWAHDDVSSATPRAFLAPIFLAFLYYLTQRQLLPCLATIVLQGLFYPQYVFVFAGLILLQPLQWHQGKLQFSLAKKDYRFWAILLGAAVLVMLPYALTASAYGPTITEREARSLAEFYRQGRSSFFTEDIFGFWLYGDRSGIFPDFRPHTIAIGVILPLLIRFPRRFPLVEQLRQSIKLLPQLAVTGLFLFIAAHLLLFKLHLPSRYTGHTLRLVLALATALSLTLLLDTGLRWMQANVQPKSSFCSRQWLVGGLAGLLGMAILLYPHLFFKFPKTNYQQATPPGLYRFLQQQPKDIIVAGTLEAANNVPSLANRSVLVSKEYAIPYHTGYANQFRQRAIDLINAQYSLDRAEVANFLRSYGIDYWLVSREAFEPEFLDETWIRQYPVAITAAKANLKRGNPFLKRAMNRCAVWTDKAADVYVLDATCLLPKDDNSSRSPANRSPAN